MLKDAITLLRHTPRRRHSIFSSAIQARCERYAIRDIDARDARALRR